MKEGKEGGRKEERKDGRAEGRKDGRKGGRKEVREKETLSGYVGGDVRRVSQKGTKERKGGRTVGRKQWPEGRRYTETRRVRKCDRHVKGS